MYNFFFCFTVVTLVKITPCAFCMLTTIQWNKNLSLQNNHKSRDRIWEIHKLKICNSNTHMD